MIVDASENWWYQYHQPGGLGHRLREQGYCSHKISDNVSMLVIFNKYYLYHELSHHMTNFSIISPTQVHARFRYWRTRFRFFFEEIALKTLNSFRRVADAIWWDEAKYPVPRKWSNMGFGISSAIFIHSRCWSGGYAKDWIKKDFKLKTSMKLKIHVWPYAWSSICM